MGVVAVLSAMFRRVLQWVSARVGNSRDAETEDGDDSRFVPSVLDASVRYAHGQSNTGLDQEIADIDDEARRLEEHRDH